MPEPIAQVGERVITTDEYVKVLTYREFCLECELSHAMTEGMDKRIAELQQKQGLLHFEVLELLIESELIRREAPTLGIAASDAEISTEITRQFGLAPRDCTEQTSAGDGSWFEAAYRRLLSACNLTQAEHSRIVDGDVLRRKVREHLRDQVPVKAEQVHIQGILVQDKLTARNICTRVKKGEAWEQLARQFSRDPASKERGADLGWFPRGVKNRELEDTAFALTQNEISDVVKTGERSYWIVRLVERQDARPIDDHHLKELRNASLERWIEAKKRDTVVKRFMDSTKYQEAVDQIKMIRKDWFAEGSA